jgi:hypothetical protein
MPSILQWKRKLENANQYRNVCNGSKASITETIRLKRLNWFGQVQRMEENRIPKKVLYINLETTRLRGRPRNIRQDEVKENERLVGGKGWKESIHNREEWKLMRAATNHHNLHMPIE